MSDLGDPGSRPNPVQASTATNGILLPPEVWADIREALTAADSILSLLHHRGATIHDPHGTSHGSLAGLDADEVKSALNKVLTLTRGGVGSKPRLDCAVRSAMFLPQ